MVENVHFSAPYTLEKSNPYYSIYHEIDNEFGKLLMPSHKKKFIEKITITSLDISQKHNKIQNFSKTNI